MTYWVLTLLLLIVQLTCIGLLWASCFPGVLADSLGMFGFLILFSLVVIALAVLLAVFIGLNWVFKRSTQVLHLHDANTQKPEVVYASRRQLRAFGFGTSYGLKQKPHQKRPIQYPERLAIATSIIVLATAVLLLLNLPQKMTFAVSRPAFDAFVADAAQIDRLCNHPYSGAQMTRQLGQYRVLACDRDPRGGVYLQTYEGGFMITESYGFAYRPNPQGSRRFSDSGPRDYQVRHIAGDWYWFRGSRDPW